MIDLHVHTTASDGSLSPAEIVKLAKKVGISVIGVTDHDTTAGNQEALDEGERLGVKVIPGVELSIDGFKGTVHILGYFKGKEWIALEDRLSRVKDGREERNKEICNRLRSLGFDIEYKDLIKVAGSNIVGRPHIAKVLVDKGVASNMQDAFRRYLGKGKAAYVDRYRLTAKEAISFIREAVGVSVLAHPATIKFDRRTNLDSMVKNLMEFGLEGIEAFSVEHRKEQTKNYMSLAKNFGLIITGGTDFHGDLRPGVEIGIGHGKLDVPYSSYENLRDRLNRLDQ